MAVVVSARPPDVRGTLLLMARRATVDIRARAFPADGSAGKTPEGQDFAPLSQRYRHWKVAKGRHGEPDQRFTSKTANALNVTKRTPNSITIGFTVRRDVAGYLNDRNRFWGLSPLELQRVLRIADRMGSAWAKGVKISGGIVIQAGRKPGA